LGSGGLEEVMDVRWLNWIPLVAVGGCILATRGAVIRAVLLGLAFGFVGGVTAVVEEYRDGGIADALSFWLFFMIYWAWVAGGIGALRCGHRRAAAFTLGMFAAYAVIAVSLWD
jgi:hypothetical protein